MKRKDLMEGDVFYYAIPGFSPSDTLYVDTVLPGAHKAALGKSRPRDSDMDLPVTLVWRESTERHNARTGTISDNPASVPNQLGDCTAAASAASSTKTDGGTESADTAARSSVGCAGNVRGSIYAKLDPEPIDAIEGWGLNFRLANVIKYVARHGRKPGATASSDLRKALNYLKREIAAIEGVRSWECDIRKQTQV